MGPDAATDAAKGARPSVLVVTVAYLSSPLLMEHLRSIRASSWGTRMRHIVVDNSCETEARCVVRRFKAASQGAVSYLPLKGNPGYGAAANVGWSLARRGEYVLVTNPDLALKPGHALRMLIDAIDCDPTVLASCPTLTSSGGEPLTMREGLPTPWNYPKWILSGLSRKKGRPPGPSTTVVNLSGSAIMLSPQFADLVGQFDEEYFLFMEDVDISKRLAESGFRAVELANVRSEHVGGASMARVGKSPVALQGLVSRGIYFDKHFNRAGMRFAMLWVWPEAILYSILRMVRYRRLALLAETAEMFRIGASMWIHGAVAAQDTLVRPRFQSVPFGRFDMSGNHETDRDA